MATPATPDGVPVGTIVAYAAEPAQLPDEWRICDGGVFGTTSFPALFAAIGYANGGSGNSFQIPDLRGRFIRGQDPNQNRLPGKVMPWKTAAPAKAFSVTLDMLATDWHYTNKAGEAESRMIDWFDSTSQWTVASDAETRPVNIYLHWVIKVLPLSKPKDDIPVGGIIPFGGSESQRPSVQFPSYIRCDGTSVDARSVQDLVELVGNTFTNNPSTQTWYAPNLTGKFIRGVDPSGKNDPEFAKRNPAPNGNSTGLGTWQGSATALKGASVPIANLSKHWHRVYQYKPSPNNRNISDESYIDTQLWRGGDAESRPVNASAHYYINSVKASGGSGVAAVFPIGGIIAIPGTPNPPLNPKVWLECDGTTVSKTAWPALFSAIGDTWNSTAQAGQFGLPMLRGWFLRAADTNGSTNGDPDWSTRFNLQNNTVARGPGSYQRSATGRPNSLYVNCQYPTATTTNAKTVSTSTNRTAAASGPQTFSLKADWDDETIPNTVVVKYYIRAA